MTTVSIPFYYSLEKCPNQNLFNRMMLPLNIKILTSEALSIEYIHTDNIPSANTSEPIILIKGAQFSRITKEMIFSPTTINMKVTSNAPTIIARNSTNPIIDSPLKIYLLYIKNNFESNLPRMPPRPFVRRLYRIHLFNIFSINESRIV